MEKQMLSLLQNNATNILVVEVQNLLSVNSGSSIKVVMRIITLRKVVMTSMVQRSMILTVTQTIISGGLISNMSTSSSFSFVKGISLFVFWSTIQLINLK